MGLYTGYRLFVVVFVLSLCLFCIVAVFLCVGPGVTYTLSGSYLLLSTCPDILKNEVGRLMKNLMKQESGQFQREPPLQSC